MKTLYWNDGRPVMVDGERWRIFPEACVQANWRVWAARYGVCFCSGSPPLRQPSRVAYDSAVWIHGGDPLPCRSKSSGNSTLAESTEAGGCKSTLPGGVVYDPLPAYPPGVPSSRLSPG